MSIHDDKAGLDEFFEQTRTTLNFQQDVPTAILGRQLAFDVLPLPGGSALAEELSGVLGHTLGVSIQPLQGPMFHGTAISAAIQFTEPAEASRVTDCLSESRVIEIAEDAANLGPRQVAGESSILVGEVEVGPDGTCRIWAVLDNLTRGGALNALELAEMILAG
jgi:aspartate-semialdehyde dehydrogenase